MNYVSLISRAWKYRNVLWNISTIPAFPTDWSDKAAVWSWVKNLVDNPALLALTLATETPWDDRLLAFLKSTIGSSAIFDTAWEKFTGINAAVLPEPEQRKRLIDRIRSRRASQTAADVVDKLSDDIALTAVDKTVELLKAMKNLDKLAKFTPVKVG